MYRRYTRLTYSAVTHSNYAQFGRDLAPLFAINFKVLSETVRAPHGPSNGRPRNFKIHQARLGFYDRPSQYRTVAGINNSISKSFRENVRLLANDVATLFCSFLCLFIQCHFKRACHFTYHKNRRIITWTERRKKMYGILFFVSRKVTSALIKMLRLSTRSTL